MSIIEIVAVVFTVVCIFLAGRNNVHTWWTGIVACLAYAYVFFGAKLYADMILQGFFIASSVYGWWVWANKKERPVVPITKSSGPYLLILGGVAMVSVAVFSFMLERYTDAAYPMIDSTVLVLSVIGQILMANRKIENWPVWLLVNTVSVPLYFSRELYLSAGLYVIFWFHAVYAWNRWKHEMESYDVN